MCNFGANQTVTKKCLPITQRPSIARTVTFRRVVIDYFALYVHQHAKAQFTTRLNGNSMELGPRSPRNAFGAARNKMPFDRVNGDI
jgi:hypothetical protein